MPSLQDGKIDFELKIFKLILEILVILFMVRIQKKRLNVKLIYGFDQMKLPIGHIQPNDGSMSEYSENQVEQTTI
jgi:hypothetical protein